MTDYDAGEMGLRWLDAGFVSVRTQWLDFHGMNVPDPRDPGNKGHAMAQIRERLDDPYVCLIFRFYGAEWHIDTTEHDNFAVGETEEDCITDALEATKPCVIY